jgi:arylsulfatase A-like enzyme
LKNYGPFRGHKTTMYEGGLRVPMLARWPGRIPAGTVSHYAWMFEDAMPTFAEISGANAPENIDGISVLPTLLGNEQQPHDYLYWEFLSFNAAKQQFRPGTPPQALRMGDWKVVRPTYDAALELYNLASDPGEAKNLAAQEPSVLARLEAALKTARTEPRMQSQPDHRWFEKPWW